METIDINQLHDVLKPSAPKADPCQAEGEPGWHLDAVDAWKEYTSKTIADVLQPIENSATAHALQAEDKCIEQKLEQLITTKSPYLPTAFDALITHTSDSALVQKVRSALDLPTPSPLLLKNPYFAQRMLQYLHDHLPEEGKHIAGVILSMLLWNTLEHESEETRNAHQIINLSDIGSLDGIAIRWPRGKLTILGRAGNRTGAAMSGGELFIPESTGHGAFSFMCGGQAHIGNAGASLGQYMRGGTIFVSHAGPFAGYSMRGGNIYAEEVEHDCGQVMRCGTITVAAERKVLRPKKSWFRR